MKIWVYAFHPDARCIKHFAAFAVEIFLDDIVFRHQSKVSRYFESEPVYDIHNFPHRVFKAEWQHMIVQVLLIFEEDFMILQRFL